jgi:heat shock protein HslJ
VSRTLGWSALSLLVAGCASVGAPTIDELQNGTIHGIAEAPITLRGGAWEGEPYQPGGASRLRVTLLDQPIAVGDLDGRPGDEMAAILSASTGGSASLVYVAVFSRRDDGRLAPAVAVLVGDRIKVHAMSIAARRVTLDIVEAGPGDPLCCPSRLARKSYALQGPALVPVASTAGGNVSLAELAGTEWTLSSLDDRPLPTGARPPTLLFGDARVSGFGGCNRYTGPVSAKRPGTLSVGPLATTKMACAAPAMDVEDRYLAALAAVSQYALVAGRLQLSGTLAGTSRTLTFERRAAPAPGDQPR